MSAPKHTPGPWTATTRITGDEISPEETHVELIRKPGVMGQESIKGICLVHSWGIRDAEHHANARLIAAAPDLLEALVEARDVIDSKIGLTDAILDQIRAAIARAEGGEG